MQTYHIFVTRVIVADIYSESVPKLTVISRVGRCVSYLRQMIFRCHVSRCHHMYCQHKWLSIW